MNSQNQEKIIEYLKEGFRLDGRKLDEYREIKVETGVVANAEGSARVKIGETELIVGVKMAVEKPYPDTPEDGSLMVGAEFLPIAHPDFEQGPPQIEAIELARVVDRGIRESKAIDTKKLCIEKGEKVWIVIVDICTINVDGNLFDASALGAVLAIQDAKFPEVKDGAIDYKAKTDEPLPLEKVPVSVTVWKIGDSLIVDPLLQEEKNFDSRLTVASLEDGTICAMQKGGEEALSLEELDSMTELALKKSAELRKYLK